MATPSPDSKIGWRAGAWSTAVQLSESQKRRLERLCYLSRSDANLCAEVAAILGRHRAHQHLLDAAPRSAHSREALREIAGLSRRLSEALAGLDDDSRSLLCGWLDGPEATGYLEDLDAAVDSCEFVAAACRRAADATANVKSSGRTRRHALRRAVDQLGTAWDLHQQCTWAKSPQSQTQACDAFVRAAMEMAGVSLAQTQLYELRRSG